MLILIHCIFLKVLKLVKKTKYWLLASIAFTYALIFVGGFVRVSDSGLGCPDWPKCFDRWYPPLHSSEIPENFTDYYDNYNCTNSEECDDFDITKAWIEYINRLFGAITGLVMLVAVFYLYKVKTDYQAAFYLGASALLLTGVEGLIGKYVVTSHLDGSIITVHLLIALVIISFLIMSYRQITWNKQSDCSVYSLDQTYIIKWIFILMSLGIVLGTQVRADIENLIPLSAIGPFKYAHSFLGIGTLMLTGVLWNKINNEKYVVKTKALIKMLLNIFIVQIILGYFMVFGGLPAYAKLIHMWFASIGLGIITYILMDIRLSSSA